MQYINLTPRWTEILTVWQRIVERCNSAKRYHREDYNKNMNEFWAEMKRMAQGADNFNDLVAFLRNQSSWTDENFKSALAQGREYQEQERNTIRESDDA